MKVEFAKELPQVRVEELNGPVTEGRIVAVTDKTVRALVKDRIIPFKLSGFGWNGYPYRIAGTEEEVRGIVKRARGVLLAERGKLYEYTLAVGKEHEWITPSWKTYYSLKSALRRARELEEKYSVEAMVGRTEKLS